MDTTNMTAIQKFKHAMKKIFFPEDEVKPSSSSSNLTSRTGGTPADLPLPSPSLPSGYNDPSAASGGGMIFSPDSISTASAYPPSDTQHTVSESTFSDPSVIRQNIVNNYEVTDYHSLTEHSIHPSFLTDRNFSPGSIPTEMQKNEPLSNSMSFPFSTPSDRDTASRMQQWEELLLTADAPGGMTERGDFTALPSPPGGGELNEMLTRITETAEGVAAISETLRNFEQEFYT